jgi:Arabinose efflux permease
MKTQSLKIAFTFTVLAAIGMNFHHPVLPTLFTELGLPARIFGNASAVLCLFCFITAPVWGEMSNYFGRVKIFTIACILYGCGQFILGRATTESGVLIARMISGLFSEGVGIANLLYIVDRSEPKNRGKNVALYTAIQTVSSSFGYLFGGFIGTYGHYNYNFIIQGIWMISVGLGALVIQKESSIKQAKEKTLSLLKKANPFRTFARAGSLLNKVTMPFFISVLLTGFASTCYDNAFNYYLKDQLGFIPAYNGILKASIGIIGLIVNFTLTLWLMKQRNLTRKLSFVLLLCASSAMLGVINGGLIYFIIINLVFFTGIAVFRPVQRSLAIEGRSVNDASLAVGLYNSMTSAGNVFGGVFAGFIYGYHAQSPFVLAAIIFMLAVICNSVYDKRTREV